MEKETMELTYWEKGRKAKESINISDMSAEEILKEVERITGKGDGNND